MSEPGYINLDNVGHGAAAEMFERSLQNVIANICDVNTDRKKKRSITLKVEFTPSQKDRKLCRIGVTCEEKLAPVLAYESTASVGFEHGTAVAVEHAPPQQGELFGSGVTEKKPEAAGKVYPMSSAGGM